MRLFRATALTLVCLLAGVAAVTTGSEPDGYVRFLPQWLSAAPGDPPEGPRTLRIGFRSVSTISGARLTIAWPRTVSVSPHGAPESLRFEPLPPGVETVSILAEIGTLDPGRPLALDFAVEPVPGEGGVVSFTIEGTTPTGRVVREGYGVPVGRPGGPSETRHGAVEFRAVPRPQEPDGAPPPDPGEE